MRRVVIGLLLVGTLVTLVGCAGQVGTVETFTQRALEWLLGAETPAPATTPAQLLATPTLAPAVRATRTLPAATPDSGAPMPSATPAAGVFDGDFAGTAYGDNDTTAPISLDLTHRNGEVAGIVTIGEGLQVAAGGLCGTVPVPATAFVAQAPLAAQSRRLETTATLTVEGFDLDVSLVAVLSGDGQTITAQATLFTPALCARDPVVQATLARQ